MLEDKYRHISRLYYGNIVVGLVKNVKSSNIWEGLNLENNYKITEAKLELMQKIINAHLTEDELTELTQYASELLHNRNKGEEG